VSEVVEVPRPPAYVEAHGLPADLTFPTLAVGRLPGGVLTVLPHALLFGVADPAERQLVVDAAPDDLWAEVHDAVEDVLEEIEAFVSGGPGPEEQVFADLLSAVASRPAP
jgi:hypothetical protein